MQVAPERPTSFFRYVQAIFSISQPRWGAIALASSLLLFLGFWVVKYNFGVSQQDNQVAAVSFDEDKADNTVRFLRACLDKRTFSATSSEETRREVDEVNAKLSEFNELIRQNQVQPSERAEVSKLLAKYESALTLHQAAVRTTSGIGESSRVPKVTKDPDSKTIGSVYTAVDQALSKKNNKIGEPVSDLERAKAVQSASQQVNVEAVEGNRIVVRDMIPSRGLAEQTAVQKALNAVASQRNVFVDYSFGQQTMQFRPNINMSLKSTSAAKP